MNQIIQEFVLRVSPLIHTYGALGVFVVSVIEEIIAPIPSSFILLGAGFFLLPASESMSEVLFNALIKIVIPGGLGLAVGSMFLYSFAYIGGEPAIKKWGRWVGVSWGDVERMESRLTKSYWDEFILFAIRTVPIAPQALVSLVCGIIRYPMRNFFVTTLLGGMLRSFLMGLLGWYLGEAYIAYSDNITTFATWIGWVILGIIVISAVYLYLKKRSKKRVK